MGHMMNKSTAATTPSGPVDDPNERSFGTQRGGIGVPVQHERQKGAASLARRASSGKPSGRLNRPTEGQPADFAENPRQIKGGLAKISHA
jgi:hypothetical protein